MKKKILSLLLCICMTTTMFVGCGSVNESEKNGVVKEETTDGTLEDQVVGSEKDTEIVSNTEESNLGESLLTGNITNVEDYVVEIKLEREKIRSEERMKLMEIFNNEELSEEERQDAANKMVELTEIAEMEANVEMFLEAKGFTYVVVIIDENSCSVVLDGDITDAKHAQVEDIVERKTGISADKIVIKPLNTSSEE